MRHTLRNVVVVGTSALLLTTGAGTAAAQGSLALPFDFPLEIPGLASLAPATGAAADTPEQSPQGQPAFAVPEELAKEAFKGRIVAGINESRTAVGAERLVTDPALSDRAAARAEELAAGDTTTGDLPVPEESPTSDRTTLDLPADATPTSAMTAQLGDTGMRERMLYGEFTRVGVGLATADDGHVHVVVDFER
ncbi:hypothetical protein NCCP2495_20000 [Dietzia sp. NCCP-2495]|uniref:CAP domain-containing protein n=1 Tax=Dietzia sp. NCCP-2495 TaxID=2934675 RepID=UPI002230F96E|nr:CAP domain-containing protein [Dietzia sp. NCCP-2495]GLB64121.1 hypothetical protein NCCP2495_20000 [Dietzia sp. NCCP-2495]